uniref:Uncharacterized protein n=1 Tax=Ursus americanus TaxID=9643 RepID=A0A452QUT5_URSAM
SYIIANNILSRLLFLSLPSALGERVRAAFGFSVAFPSETSSLTVSLLPRVAEVLEGKGAGKKGRFQGKATRMSRRAEVRALLQDYISTQTKEH